MAILIGTSGFSYDDWKGHFYPANLKKGDMLSFYARVFPVVEINSTYYRIPTPEVMTQMARKVPAGFEFVLKAHQDMTHSGDFHPEAFAEFREAMAALRDEGMLGCVLAQFPWSFRRTPEHVRYLEVLRDELPEVPVVVEFRNADWVQEPTFDRLRSLRLGYCCVDEPRLKGLVPRVCTATSPVGYVRFHGRNYKKWWNHQYAYERYDYTYPEAELQEWVPKVQELAGQTEKTYVFFNNHYVGQAAQNARQMAELLDLTLTGADEPQASLGL